MGLPKYPPSKTIWLLVFLPFLGLLAPATPWASEGLGKRKVLVLWSSSDTKEEEAARSLKEKIKEFSPHSEIELKNIEDFAVSHPPAPLNEALLFFLRKNNATAEEISSVLKTERETKYDADGLNHFLSSQNPDAVITTHLGSLMELEKAHERGPLQDKKVSVFFPGETQRDLENITREVFEEAPKGSPDLPEKFGMLNGVGVADPTAALEQLNFDAPSEVELLLSEAMGKKNWIGEPNSNPFGHLAIRIGSDVYTANQGAKKGDNQSVFYRMSLKDYLFSTKATEPNLLYNSQFGTSYARHNLGLRIRGLSAKQIEKMHAAIKAITREWRAGTLCYNFKNNNCADLTTRILDAAEISSPLPPKGLLPTLPLDTFDDYLKKFRAEARLGLELIWYSQIKGAKSPFRITHFPFGKNLFRNLVTFFDPDKERGAYPVTKRIDSSIAREIVLDPSDGISIGDLDRKLGVVRKILETRRDELVHTEAELDHWRVSLSEKAPNEELEPFQQAYEKYRTRKAEYFLDKNFFDLQNLRADLRNHLEPAQLQKVSRLLDEINSTYLNYYRKPRNPLDPYRVLSVKVKALQEKVNLMLEKERLKGLEIPLLEKFKNILLGILRAASNLFQNHPKEKGFLSTRGLELERVGTPDEIPTGKKNTFSALHETPFEIHDLAKRLKKEGLPPLIILPSSGRAPEGFGWEQVTGLVKKGQDVSILPLSIPDYDVASIALNAEGPFFQKKIRLLVHPLFTGKADDFQAVPRQLRQLWIREFEKTRKHAETSAAPPCMDLFKALNANRVH